MNSVSSLKAQYPGMSGVTMRSRIGAEGLAEEMARLRVCPYLSTTEAEFYTGLGLKSLLKLKEEGIVHAVRVSRNWCWDTESLQTMGRNAA
jgi:hypothetical protein